MIYIYLTALILYIIVFYMKKHMYEDRSYKEPLLFDSWAYVLLFFGFFIPIINIIIGIIGIIILFVILDDCYWKGSTNKLIKFLNKIF